MATVADQDLWVLGLKSQGLQPRKSITDLSNEELYLFVEGLARFQAADPNDPLSFYQIAGIHGQPYTPWPKQEWFDGVELTKDGSGNFWGGFCTHNSILFLTWHRPYLALFESQLYKHVNNAAQGLPQVYIDAAVNFRLPYWDWAQSLDPPGASFPQSALLNQNPSKPPQTMPPGTNPTANNPLFAATVPEGYPAVVGSGATTISTSRASNLQQIMKAIYANYKDQARRSALPASNLTERVGYILRSYQRFSSMSNNAWAVANPAVTRTSHAEKWGSLEDIHNSIHGGIGGNGGNMGSIDIAAFDPIFWLHHANIDRLFAIWQAAHEDDNNPDTFVVDQALADGWDNLTTRSGDNENKDSELFPFRNDQGWYTSSDVKNTQDFGYCYPETLTKRSKADMIAAMAVEYPTAADQLLASRKGVSNAGVGLLGQAHIMSKMAVSKSPATAQVKESILNEMPPTETLLARSWEPNKPILKNILTQDNKYQEWLINIKAERHALGGKYAVYFFLGPVDETNLDNWILAPTYVGTFIPLGQAASSACGKCQTQQRNHLQITGQIPLTLALMERYLAQLIPDMNEQTVKTYLATNLHWKVEVNGQILTDRSQVTGLTVFVITNQVTLPPAGAANQQPIYAPDVVIHPEITTKLDGVSGRGEGTGLTSAEVQ